MESKIERKLVELVKTFLEEDKEYKCGYETNGEDGNFIKKIEVIVNKDDFPQTIGSVEFHSYAYDNNTTNYVTKLYFTLVTDKVDITVYEETSSKLWNLLTKFINKKWNADNLLVA